MATKKRTSRKPKITIDIELKCGCKYQHYTNNSQHSFWSRCLLADQLWQDFIKSLRIEDREKYFNHYEKS